MDRPREHAGPSERLSGRALGLGLAVLALLLASKLTAPDDFDAHDQAKQGLYVVDAWQHGRWLVPMELGQIYPTKPPLMTWLSLLAALVQGRVTELGARWPSFLGAALALVGTLRFARRLGPTASLAAGLAFVANTHVIACAMLARTDMLLCAATTFAVGQVFESYALFREELPARGAFLVAAALAGIGTVAKSPVSLACPVFALAAFVLVEPDARRFLRAVALPSLPLAFLIYLAIVGAWFLPAARTAGPEFVKTLQDELFGHVAGTGAYASASKAQPFLYPFAHLTSKFLPWTIVPVAAWLGTPPFEGLLGARRQGDLATSARRFALAALAGSLVFFGLMKIKRPDHVLPCYPWAACVVGGIVADWSAGSLPRRAAKLVSAFVRAMGVVALVASVALPVALRGSRLLGIVPLSLWPLEKRGLATSLLDSLAERPGLVLGLALLAAPVGAVVWAGGRGRRPHVTIAGIAAVVALLLVVYDHALQDSLLTNKGDAIPAFSERVRLRARGRGVVAQVAPPSVLFFLGESQPFRTLREEVARDLDAGAWGVVTIETLVPPLVEERPDLVPVVWSGYYSHADVVTRLALVVRAADALEPEDPACGVARVWWCAR